jgi:tetratricopeptide (TPR) repeat protein
VAFQSRQSTFEALYNDRLFGAHGVSDRLLSHPFIEPQNADVYFIPEHRTWQWGYLGQPFFEPEPFVLEQRAAALHSEAAFDAAATLYAEIRARYPQHLLGYSEPATVLADSGNVPEAMRMGQRALRLARDNYLVLGSLAWAFYLARQYDDAITAAIEAIEGCYADDFRAYPYHSLGAALIMQQEHVRALEALRRSIARVANEPVVFMSLAQAIEASGRRDDAQRAYDDVVRVVERRVREGSITGLTQYNVFTIADLHYRSELSASTLAKVKTVLGANTSATSSAMYSAGD